MAKEKGKEKKSVRDSVKSEAEVLLTELKKFGREAGELAHRGGREITRVSQIGKLKGRIVVLNQKREWKLKELGEKLMQSKKISAIKDSKVLSVIKEIKGIEADKKSCEVKVKGLTKK